MASILGTAASLVGQELLGSAAFGGLDQIGKKNPKSFGKIIEETVSDPINFIPGAGLVRSFVDLVRQPSIVKGARKASNATAKGLQSFRGVKG